jgi:hypothetical protein
VGINAGLDEQFFLGLATASDTPYYLPIAIGAHQYLIDLKKYRRQTIAPIRPPQDNSNEPGEQSLTQEGLWRRSQSSFHLGVGQAFFDDEESTRKRMLSTKGLDVWTRRQLSLLKDTRNIRASANTNLKVLQVGTRLYITDGAFVYFTADPSVASPTFTDAAIKVSGTGTDVLSITTDGATVWAVVTGSEGTKHLHYTAAGASTSTHLANGPLEGVGYANGRLIGFNDNVLYEISRAGALTTLKTHDNTSFQWSVIASAPNAIYAAGTSVDRSEIYAMVALDSTGALAPPVLAASLPDGETINALIYYGGGILIGTSRGLRLATIGSNNSLQYGPVILIAGGVTAFEGQGEFVWFTWTNYDGTSTGLGRVNLSDFTAELVPAYASDLMATAQGTVLSVCTVSSRRYFAVSAGGFFAEHPTDYVASGSYDSGFITFGTTEKKIATALDLRHQALPDGASVAASIMVESGVATALGSSATALSLGPASPLTVEAAGTEALKVQLTLNRGATVTNNPVLRRWTLYGLVTPVLNDEIILPLIVKTKVLNQLGEGQDIAYNPLVEYNYLRELAQSKAIQRYQEGASSYNVYVSQVSLEPDDWTIERDFFNGIINVRLVTIGVL